MRATTKQVRSVAAEVEKADLSDARLTKRLARVIEAVEKTPSLSLPKIFRDPSQLEATYRFLGNEAVTPARILEPHFARTVERATSEKDVLVAHDTTTLSFGGEVREDIGWVGPATLGVFAHFALALSGDLDHRPLGAVGLSVIARSKKPPGKSSKKRFADPKKEFLRWIGMVKEVEARLGKGRAIHVLDREADAYQLLCNLAELKARSVVRMAYNRMVAGAEEGMPAELMKDVLARREDVVFREVPINRRGKKGRSGKLRKTHPVRKARVARLGVRTAQLTLQRPVGLNGTELPATLKVNVVYVHELDAPEGEPPVEWCLVTSEPIDTPEQIEAVVDHYRGRWRIEEFFKALKTGCSIEKRQLESKHGLLNLLAVFTPIAWQLLTLRTLARCRPDEPASEVFTERQLKILKKLSFRKLADVPTIHDAFGAIASLAGHLKQNGEPGWQTLGFGLEQLLSAEAIWLALHDADL